MLSQMILAIDAGGTSIKYTLLRYSDLAVLTEPRFFAVPCLGTREELLDVFEAVFRDAVQCTHMMDSEIICIALSVPGPFDCASGISRMSHKWQAIKDVPLVPEFIRMGIFPADIPVVFLHDVHSFLVGEQFFGQAASYRATAGIVIGTGLGFGLWKNNSLMLNKNGGPLHSIFCIPYHDGILEDYVSGRALSSMYREKTGDTLDARSIAELAHGGNAEAVETFSQMGHCLGDAATPILTELGIDCIVFGGRISCSYDLFSAAFCEELRKHGSTAFLYPSRDLEIAAMRGVSVWAKQCIFGSNK